MSPPNQVSKESEDSLNTPDVKTILLLALKELNVLKSSSSQANSSGLDSKDGSVQLEDTDCAERRSLVSEPKEIRGSVFRIVRSKSGSRKRTYYWKLYELAYLFMVSFAFKGLLKTTPVYIR